jgi:hypothetical protein
VGGFAVRLAIASVVRWRNFVINRVWVFHQVLRGWWRKSDEKELIYVETHQLQVAKCSKSLTIIGFAKGNIVIVKSMRMRSDMCRNSNAYLNLEPHARRIYTSNALNKYLLIHRLNFKTFAWQPCCSTLPAVDDCVRTWQGALIKG